MTGEFDYSITIPSNNSDIYHYWNDNTTVPYWNNWFYTTYPTTVYKYQVQCPKTSCKAMNWLELDKITPCIKCGAKLKAVVEQEDYTIPVTA